MVSHNCSSWLACSFRCIFLIQLKLNFPGLSSAVRKLNPILLSQKWSIWFTISDCCIFQILFKRNFLILSLCKLCTSTGRQLHPFLLGNTWCSSRFTCGFGLITFKMIKNKFTFGTCTIWKFYPCPLNFDGWCSSSQQKEYCFHFWIINYSMAIIYNIILY